MLPGCTSGGRRIVNRRLKTAEAQWSRSKRCKRVLQRMSTLVETRKLKMEHQQERRPTAEQQLIVGRKLGTRMTRRDWFGRARKGRQDLSRLSFHGSTNSMHERIDRGHKKSAADAHVLFKSGMMWMMCSLAEKVTKDERG